MHGGDPRHVGMTATVAKTFFARLHGGTRQILGLVQCADIGVHRGVRRARICVMAQTVSIILFEEDRNALEVIAADRSRPLKHIQRAKIVLYSPEARLVVTITEVRP